MYIGFFQITWYTQNNLPRVPAKPRGNLQVFKTQSLDTLFLLVKNMYRVIQNDCGVLTTCHTQYTSDSSICLYLFNRATLTVFVTYLTDALYVHPLWFYKHQHDNPVRSKLSVACQRWWFEWRFWFVPSVPGYLREEEEHKPDPWRNPHRNKSHGVASRRMRWQVVKTPTIISNSTVFFKCCF